MMKLVEIKDVRVGQIWKDKDNRLWLQWDTEEKQIVRNTIYFKRNKGAFNYLLERGYKLVGFYGITHEIKNDEIVEIIPPYKDQKVQKDDIVRLVEDESIWLVDTTYNSHKYSDYISLLSFHNTDFSESEVEKVGTLGVNYEFVHNNFKELRQ